MELNITNIEKGEKGEVNNLEKIIEDYEKDLKISKIVAFKSSHDPSFKDFVKVPFFVLNYYRNDFLKPLPSFLTEYSDFANTGLLKNPFFDNARPIYFVAYENNFQLPVARVMAYVDDLYFECDGNKRIKVGWIGGFESINNNIGLYLLNAAVKYLKAEEGVDKVIGNAKFNANGEIGVMIESKVMPNVLEPYNPLYYNDFFVKSDFTKETDWYGYAVKRDMFQKNLEVIKRVSEYVATKYPKIAIRSLNRDDLRNEVKKLMNFYNREWFSSEHPQFRKITKKEIKKLVKDLKSFVIPELCVLAFDQDSLVGVMINLPNVYESIAKVDKNFKNQIQSQIQGDPAGVYFSLKRYTELFNLIQRDLRIYRQIKKDMKNKDFKSFRTLIFGIDKKYRVRGIESLMFSYLNGIFQRDWQHVEFISGSELAETNNHIVNYLQKLGERTFTWRVYANY